MNDPEVLCIVSVDSSPYDSAEWFSRIRYKLSQSESMNKQFRWVCWSFKSLPEALGAITQNPQNEFVYLRIDPSTDVLESYLGGNRQYLEQALEPIKKRNCIVVFEEDHTSVKGIDLPQEMRSQSQEVRSQSQADSASDLIKEMLQYRTSGKSALLAQQIDHVATMGTSSINDLRRQIGSLMKRCDRLEAGVETLQDVVHEHSEDLQKIRAWVGRGKGLLGAIGKKAIAKLLLAMGAGAGITWLIEVLMG